MRQLLQSVQTSCCPAYSAVVLLRALSHVNGQVSTRTSPHGQTRSEFFPHTDLFLCPQSVLATLLPVLDRLLEQSGPDTPTLLRAEAQLMHLVLGKFNEASAPLLVQDQNCLELFARALNTSTQQHPDIPSCQISALEQVSLT